MSGSNVSWPRQLGLHAGDWVVVRSREEILATLDRNARLDNLPFQPEMLAFCGQRMRVAKVAHKTCDTINKTGGRRMLDAVHLEGGRCNGAAHGGCEADCVFFWKEAWLRREDDVPSQVSGTTACTPQDVERAVFKPGEAGQPDPAYVCQTTSLYEATTLLRWWDVRQYVRDVTTGNHGALHIAKLLVAAWYRRLVGLGVGYRLLVGLYDRWQRLTGGKPFPVGTGTIPDGKPTPHEVLDLKPGDWVEVKSPKEIQATITRSGFNRGMRYDMEMAKYSGERHRVQMRVSRLINEQTGKMMQMKSACIQLEDVYCRAECTPMRLACPRASNTYWREIWLRRVDGPETPPPQS
ncbi:hypothetical protein [Piscinibacter sp. XHJ-5]|uniref:hypothetical protein n=1 Tax=Piscinibacter sp. XHJ-5 TaxID=3037797 RepID=UPI002452D459|nr:hypothetical protein [Piscinibacter sp. XHJ-5]